MQLQAPSHWQCIDFISDLHLQAQEHETFAAWRSYLQGTTANAVFILGDLFEVWVGDDVLADSQGFEYQCAHVLAAAAKRLDIFIMHGNRDFLMGPVCMQACHATLLHDPTVLTFAQQRWLLTHGDAMCLDDTAYMQFRQLVRGAAWQTEFLGKPLPERIEMARQLRTKSESIKRESASYVDLSTDAVNHLLQVEQATTMVHGHTHRPGEHVLPYGCKRIVLSDWDVSAKPPRADVLRIRQSAQSAPGYPVVERLTPAQACAIAPKTRV
jgi:UDP-2,3-diacylglucosamine hydrolase